MTMAEHDAEPGAGPAVPRPGQPIRPADLPVQGDQIVKATLLRIYDELFAHDGYASLKVEMRLLRRGQKEVILDAGKQFRFVVDFPARGRGKRP